MKNIKSSIFPLRQPLPTACLSLLFLLGGLVNPVVANDIYVAQNNAGGGTGADAADALSMAWLNNSANWGSGANQIGPGTTVHLVGTITTGFSIQGNGSPGNPITVHFEPNAIMTAPLWTNGPSTYCAIYGGVYNNVVIDGGSNGIIQATACGDGLTAPTGCNGIVFGGASGVVVKNLTIQNLFVRTQWSTNLIGSGSAVSFGASLSGGDLVTNCVFHDMQIGVGITFGAGCSNYEISGNTIYNCNWGGYAGDSGSTSVLNGLLVRNNKFYNWANWDDSGDNFHHNGFYGWAESGGILTNVTISGNTVGSGFGADNTSGVFFSGQIWNLLINNNLFLGTDGTSPANGFVTVGFHGTATTADAAFIFNNTFIGSGNGTAISLGSGLGANLTTYTTGNNLVQGLTIAVFQTYYQNATMNNDYDLYWNLSYPLNNPNPGQSSPFVISSSANSAYLNWYMGPWNGSNPSWVVYAHDVHGVTNNPNLNSSYVPQPGSAAIGAGTNISSRFTTDFYGNPRPLGTNAWDIGAFQSAGTVIPTPTGFRFATQ